MPEDYTLLPNVIDVVDLLLRWTGISQSELAAMVHDGVIPAFWQVKRIKNDDGETISCCVAGKIHECPINDDWSNIVFRLEDVEQLESYHPEFKWTPENFDKPQNSDTIDNNTEDEWISCYVLSKRWGWSTFDVVDFIKSGELRCSFEGDSFYGGPDLNNLNDIYVHIVDLLSWEEKNKHRIKSAPVLEKDGERLRQEIRSLTQKIAELEIENAALRSKIEASLINPPKQPGPPKPPRTAAASKAAAEKKVEEWKCHATRMITVVLECAKEGPKARKRPQLQAIAKRHGGEFSRAALEVLWAALPDEHKSTEPGPPRQS